MQAAPENNKFVRVAWRFIISSEVSALGRFGEYRRCGLRPIPLGFTEYIAME
jgi:hypothetical protein